MHTDDGREMAHGLARPARCLQGGRQRQPRLKVVGLDANRFGKLLARFLPPTLLLQQIAQIMVRVRIVGRQANGLAITFGGSDHVTLRLQQHPQIVVRFGIVRLETHGLAVAGHRIGWLVECAVDFAERSLEAWATALKANCGANELQGRVVLSDLEGQQAQQMQGVRVSRVSLEYLAIELLGLPQVAGVVAVDRSLQGLGNCFHREFAHFRPPLAHQSIHICR